MQLNKERLIELLQPELLKELVSWKSSGTEREMRREIEPEDRYDYITHSP